MLTAVKRIMEKLKLPVNEQKTRCLRCPEEPFDFLGYRIGWNYRRTDGSRYIGTRPSKASVQSICHRISEVTAGNQHRDPEEIVTRVNRLTTGWANYFHLGEVGTSYRAINRHATQRLRRWLCRKHKVKSGKYVRFPDQRLHEGYGLVRVMDLSKRLPWAKA